MGPANKTPQTIKPQWPAKASPEDTTPQAKAHMGGNQVMGLSSSATVDRDGRAMVHFWPTHPNCQLRFTIISSEISDTFRSLPLLAARTENTILVRRGVAYSASPLAAMS